MKVSVYKVSGKHLEEFKAQGTLVQMEKGVPLVVWGDYGITTTPIDTMFSPKTTGDILVYTQNSTYRVVFDEVMDAEVTD